MLHLNSHHDVSAGLDAPKASSLRGANATSRTEIERVYAMRF